MGVGWIEDGLVTHWVGGGVRMGVVAYFGQTFPSQFTVTNHDNAANMRQNSVKFTIISRPGEEDHITHVLFLCVIGSRIELPYNNYNIHCGSC